MANKNFKVSTKIKVLKDVWKLLKGLGLKELLGGKEGAEKELDITSLLDALLESGKLVEFCQIVTGDTQTDFEDLEFEEVGGLISDFFGNIGKSVPMSALASLKTIH